MEKQEVVYPYNGICSAIKRNEVLMNLENNTLSEKNDHVFYDSIYMKCPDKSVKTESVSVIVKG